MRRLLFCLLACACSARGSRDHTPPEAALAAYPAAGAAPLSVRFDGTGSRDDVGVADFRWDFGDGAAGRGAVTDHIFASRGSYDVKLTAYDAAGNHADAHRTIEVSAPEDSVAPTASFTASATAGVAPLPVQLDARGSSDDTGITAYVWDFGDGQTASGAQAAHVYASSGSWHCKLTVQDAAGNLGVAEKLISVTAPAQDQAAPTAVLKAFPQAGLAPLRVHFDGTASSDDVGITRTQLELGDGRILAGPVQDATYAVSGRYSAKLTVWDGAGNTGTDTAVISVETLPITPAERVYADALLGAWQDWSWSKAYSLSSTAQVHTGASAISFVPQSWEGLHFHHAQGFDTHGYDRLSLWLNGGTAGGQKLLVAARYDGKLGAAVPLEQYVPGGAIPRAAWAQALVPLAALGAQGAILEGIIVQDGSGTSQAQVFLDDLTLFPELGGPSLAPCPALPASSSFVSRQGGSLWLDQKPFRAAGANVYYLQGNLANAQQLGDAARLKQAREELDVLVCLGLPVVRTWAFNERTAAEDVASMMPGPNQFREEGLLALDQAVAEVKERGLRVILTLSDNWAYYGGLDRYASWVGKSHDDFFTDAQLKGFWKSYAARLLSRVNTVTGVRYRDEPAILAWEIGNEYRCHSCAGTAKLHAALQEQATYLASLGPSQLIADGGEGFDDQPSGWGLSNSYPVSGGEGASFSTLSSIPELDLLSFHVYPVSWGLSAQDTLLWYDGHQQRAASGGKVAYPGEYGWQGDDAARAAKLDQWNDRLYRVNSGQLGFLWQVLPEGIPNNDGFGVYYPSDALTLGVLQRWAAAAR